MCLIIKYLRKYKIFHLAFWILLFFWHYHQYLANAKNNLASYLLETINLLIFQMIAVYTTIYFLVPRYFYKAKFLKFIGGCFLVLVLVSIFTNQVSHIIYFIVHDKYHLGIGWIAVISHFIDVFLVTTIFTITSMIQYYYEETQLNKEREKERLHAELNYLKAQMNPHFLFNALNSIYVLIDEDQNQSKETLAKFSNLLRYQLYDCGNESVLLNKELQFIEDYVNLEKIRNGSELIIRFNIGYPEKELKIAPLLLMPFVENAFKHHTMNTEQKQFINIDFSFTKNVLTLKVENSYTTSQHSDSFGGIGLANVKRRLDLLYSKTHKLTSNQQNGCYSVQLEIDLDET